MNRLQWRPLIETNSFLEDAYVSPFPVLRTDLAVDVYKIKNDIIAEMSLPGVQKIDIDISVQEEWLTVSGQREEELEVNQRDFFSKEIRRGAFVRTVRLPQLVEANQAVARYENGVLTIIMPVLIGVKEKGIKVKVEA